MSDKLTIRRINRVRECAANVAALEKAFQEAAVSGTASATISSNGGSKSYSRVNPETISRLIGYWKTELLSAKRALVGGRPLAIKSVMITRS